MSSNWSRRDLTPAGSPFLLALFLDWEVSAGGFIEGWALLIRCQRQVSFSYDGCLIGLVVSMTPSPETDLFRM
jgi:hypothetical protein